MMMHTQIEESINWSKNYEDKLSSFAGCMDENFDTRSQIQKFSFLNLSSPSEFRKNVSDNGTNPLAKVYGLFN